MSEFKAAVAGESEAQWRQFLSYLFTQSSTGIAATGVLQGMSVQQTTTASANVLVNIGAVVTQASLTAGASPMLNNAQKTLDVLTANPMGATPRNDLVVFNPASSAVELVVGTPNAVPTDPTPPTGSVSLARLRHAASATTVPTAKIDDMRTMTRWQGDAFAREVRTVAQPATAVAGALIGPYAQTFTAGRFTVAPRLTFGVEGSRLVAFCTSITTSGFNLYLRNVAASDSPSGAETITWTAVQMTPTSATG